MYLTYGVIHKHYQFWQATNQTQNVLNLLSKSYAANAVLRLYYSSLQKITSYTLHGVRALKFILTSHDKYL